MTRSTCPIADEDLLAFVDAELLPAERTRVEDHVATCLTCRRETERLAAVNALVRGLPRIEPSPDFETAMWRRLAREAHARKPRTRSRVLRWSMPVFAAAAAIALVLYSVLSPSGPRGGSARGGGQVATAPVPRQDVARATRPGDTRVASAPGAENVDDTTVANLGPEDLPPELVDHPELFLHFPVVRRLKKLEHFEEVRKREESEPLGRWSPEGQSVG